MTIRSLRWTLDGCATDISAMEQETWRTVLFRHREALLVLMSIPVIVAALRGGGIDRIAALLGTIVVSAGVLLRLCAVRQIGRGARVFHAHARTGLISSGPYRWTRNPLYLAAALMLCGLGLIADAGWVAVALLVATLLAYTPIVRIEERALIALFGDSYQHYLASVPRWFGFRHLDADSPGYALVGWREVFRRERLLVPGTLAAMLAIAAVRGEWVPLPELANRVELAVGLDLAVLVSATTAVAVVVNAIKVERHQERRRAARSGHSHPPAG